MPPDNPYKPHRASHTLKPFLSYSKSQTKRSLSSKAHTGELSPSEPRSTSPDLASSLPSTSSAPLTWTSPSFFRIWPPEPPSVDELKPHIPQNHYAGGGIRQMSYYLREEVEWAVWDEEHHKELSEQLYERLHLANQERMNSLAEHEGVSAEEIERALEEVRNEGYVSARTEWEVEGAAWEGGTEEEIENEEEEDRRGGEITERERRESRSI